MENRYIYPDWEIIEELGGGAFSTVYRIRKTGDTEGDCDSALKVISIPASADEYRQYKGDGYDDKSISAIFKDQVSHLERELKLLSVFRGTANIVSYEDHKIVPKEDGIGYYVLIKMELLSTLPDYFGHRTISVSDAVKIGIDLCSALMLCEGKNIVHRDIKPQNIFVNSFGDYKLGDFGIARNMDHTTRATKTGTPAYMAPEVYRGEQYNNTADIYSLGLVLYWALNERRLPFLPLPPAVVTVTQNAEAQAKRIGGEALPEPKHGSDKLKAIVLKACAYNSTDRYTSAAELRKALLSVAVGMDDDQDIYSETTCVISKSNRTDTADKTAVISKQTDNTEKAVQTPEPEAKTKKEDKAEESTEPKLVRQKKERSFPLWTLIPISAAALMMFGSLSLSLLLLIAWFL